MKIVVIGVARSKTEVLIELLRQRNPHLLCLYEHYTYNLKKGLSLESISQTLLSRKDFIIKILSHNLFNNDNNIDKLNLQAYDEIYTIERPDFFNQCCSLEIAQNTKVWHQRGSAYRYTNILETTFTLSNDTILYQAQGVETYLKIKKYLNDNHLKYTNYPYNYEFDEVPNIIIRHSKLDYSKLITNYHLKNTIDNLFNSNFDYTSLKHNYNDFKNQLLGGS